MIITAKIRNENGKSASRRLRLKNKFPAIIYGGKNPSISIELDHNELWNLQKEIRFYKEVLTIVFENKKENVRIQDVQRHAYKPKIIHIDFIRTEKN